MSSRTIWKRIDEKGRLNARINPAKGRYDLWTMEEKMTAFGMYVHGRGLEVICARFDRTVSGVLTLIWKVASNYKNEGRKLLFFIRSRRGFKIDLDLEGTKWTWRQSEFLKWGNVNVDPQRYPPLSNAERGELIGRTEWAVRKQNETLFRKLEGFFI